MKQSFLYCCFFAMSLAALANFPSYSQELFSKDQRQLVLETIDNTCADSWCEGDYDFEFVDFYCNRINNVCNLSFYFINTDNDLEKKSNLQLCTFGNITNIDQIIDNSQRLSESFYELLDTCISDRESMITI